MIQLIPVVTLDLIISHGPDVSALNVSSVSSAVLYDIIIYNNNNNNNNNNKEKRKQEKGKKKRQEKVSSMGGWWVKKTHTVYMSFVV